MGLDMRPMGKPKPGFEDRYKEIFNLLQSKNEEPKQGFWGKLFGKEKGLSEEEREKLTDEWFSIQIPSYETIQAPRVGRDAEANEWAKKKYEESDKKISEEEFIKNLDGYYVIPLAKEQEGVPVYISLAEDENVFRGQFMRDTVDLIGEKLAYEAWETKLADETLDYGQRLMSVADKIAKENGLEYLKTQDAAPEADEEALESKLHIVYSLARWLIFYGKNGHGYEAYF